MTITPSIIRCRGTFGNPGTIDPGDTFFEILESGTIVAGPFEFINMPSNRIVLEWMIPGIHKTISIRYPAYPGGSVRRSIEFLMEKLFQPGESA